MAEGQGLSVEKRRFPRVALDVTLFFRVDKPPEVRLKIGRETRVGHAVDISEVGVSFLVDADIPKGTEIEISFSLMIQKGRSERVNARGLVVYSFPRLPRKTYRVGVLFTKINEADRQLIIEYVRILFMHPRQDKESEEE